MEKQKTNPDQHKINIAHQQLPDINNYKITGSIIQSKKETHTGTRKTKQILFRPNTKIKNYKTTSKNITTNETKTITMDYKF